jgi:excisionase family DNA binding protein
MKTTGRHGEVATDDEVLTVEETARRLKVSRWTVYRLLKERRLVGVLVSARCRRITVASVRAYVLELIEEAA